MLSIEAAVLSEKGGEFQVRSVSLADPQAGEVLVRIVASGICHTDLNARNQYRPVPLPAVLGHEGAGVVEAVGSGVTTVQPGDHVVFCQSSCGKCKACRAGRPFACEKAFELNFLGAMPDGTHRLTLAEKPLSHFFGQSSFATYVVAHERSVVPVPKDVPLVRLGPLGCGVQTGAGTVLNRMKPPAGASLVVFGCGTVGLSAVLAAKLVGCTTLIGVDIHEHRLALGRELGLTHTVHAQEQDPVAEIRAITGGGCDFAMDTTARPEVLRQAVDALAQGGMAVVIGGPPLGTEVSLDMNRILFERTVTGALQGNSVPQTFIPLLVDLYKRGLFPFDRLLKFYPFADINQAVHDMERGLTIKPVLVMDETFTRASGAF
ncbi:MAG: NAD(P)-dependent alcohol dehydrogenase [Alicyclobacillus sp.]|nr:NAD(P)-dependent alcohol dehydrogenase [Alicyclobacillus sp.]